MALLDLQVLIADDSHEEGLFAARSDSSDASLLLCE
ncbi:SapB/AmfS family lanthipeptide [Streptomyces sp. NPDC052101]